MDLISRQAAISFIRDKVSLSLFMKRSVDKADKACMELCEMLDRELPSAERKKGKWETVEDWDGDEHYRCSECGAEFVLIDGTPEDNDYYFCPNCGAEMRGEEDV